MNRCEIARVGLRQVNEIRTAVGSDDRVGVGRIETDQPIALRWVALIEGPDAR